MSSQQLFAQELPAVQQAGLQKGARDLTAIKEKMDAALSSKDYSQLSSYEIVAEGPTAIASTGAITPNRSLSGVTLQTLHDASKFEIVPDAEECISERSKVDRLDQVSDDKFGEWINVDVNRSTA